MASGITITPGFKGMSRDELDKVAALDYGIDPKEHSNIDSLREALIAAYENETSPPQPGPGDQDDVIEALKAQIEELKALVTAGNDGDSDDDTGVDPESPAGVIHPATLEQPWITIDLTGEG